MALPSSAALIAISVLVAREAAERLFDPQSARAPGTLVTESVALVCSRPGGMKAAVVVSFRQRCLTPRS